MTQTPFGFGLKLLHLDALLEDPSGVQCIEVKAEDFFGSGGPRARLLEGIARDCMIFVHTTCLSLGSADALSEPYLADLVRLVEWLDPTIVSHHLCWSSIGGRTLHELLPLPYNADVLAHLIPRVQAVQDRLGRQVLIENVSSYVAFEASDMTDVQLLNALCSATGCGILLDINNLVVNRLNLGADPDAALREVNPEFVAQYHLAGHTHIEGCVVDTHVGPVPDVVLALYRKALQVVGKRPTIVEWDTDIPSLAVLQDEVERIRRFACGSR